MALRSGMEIEVIWALNVLNVYLYDDTAFPLHLKHCFGLLNILVELFYAYLTILYPEVFKVILNLNKFLCCVFVK